MTTTTLDHSADTGHETHSFEITPDFILAGNAVFTVHNASGQHFTYRCSKVQKDGSTPVWFVALLTGPDNESDYTYLGMLTTKGEVRMTRASKLPEDAQSVKVIRWALRRLWDGRTMPEGYGIHGEGRCGRCGRTLTAPDGVAPDGFRFGFGPICWDKIQNGE